MGPCYEGEDILYSFRLQIIMTDIEIHDVLAIIHNFNYKLWWECPVQSIITNVKTDQIRILDHGGCKPFESFVAHLTAK